MRVPALGVLLLELGLWQSSESLYHSIADPWELLPAEAARAKLLSYVEERLGVCAGLQYQRVVRKCLNGDLERGEGGEDLLQIRFAREVTSVLAAMVDTWSGPFLWSQEREL